MSKVGQGQHTYEVVENWGKLPPGWAFGPVSAVAVDSQDRVYAFQRQDPPIIVLDSEGNYLSSWGTGTMTGPHGIYIGTDDLVYLTDRDDHVCVKLTLEGETLLVLGTRGEPSDTGCTEDAGTVLQAAGPFNKPAGMARAPSGDIYVADGYRNSRVHRFSSEGTLISSWGQPGKSERSEFHLPHCLWVDRQGAVYVCDRENSRIQVFSPAGQFITQWTEMNRPTAIYMDANETVYISELTPRISIWDKQGNLITRWRANPSPHWIYGDSKGDLYVAEPAGKRLTKYVKQE